MGTAWLQFFFLPKKNLNGSSLTDIHRSGCNTKIRLVMISKPALGPLKFKKINKYDIYFFWSNFFGSHVVSLILVLRMWEYLDMVKDPLNLKKKAKIGPQFFLQPFGALNFGFTDLGVTGYDNESFKFEKNGCCIKNVSNLLFDKFIFVSNGMWQMVMIIL